MKTKPIKECNVVSKLCGAYEENALGKCDVYSDGMCHMWLEDDLSKRIENCDHRKKMERFRNSLELLFESLNEK